MSEHQPIPFDDTEGPAYLGALWNRPLERIKPRLVELEGGGHLLFAGMTHAIAAPSGSGKSWVALATMLAAARETGLLDVAFLTPGDEIVPPGEGRLATACEQVSRHLEDNGPASKRALCGAVEGDDKTVVRAIAHLEAAGHIGRDTSGAKSGGHYPYGLLKPYRSDDEAA